MQTAPNISLDVHGTTPTYGRSTLHIRSQQTQVICWLFRIKRSDVRSMHQSE